MNDPFLKRLTISVIIPCFNCGKTVEQSVKSVYAQSRLPEEIILINDGSTDNTQEVLLRLSKECPPAVKIKLLTQPNSGPSAARNNGVRNSTSEWIAFLDSDDRWIPGKLRLEEDFIMKNPHTGILGATGVQAGILQLRFRKLLFRNYFQTSSVIVRRDLLLQYPFNESQKYSEDYRCWLQITAAEPAYVIPPLRAFPIDDRTLAYGGSGLSSNSVAMVKGELSNFKFLYKTGKINFADYVGITIFSVMKYFRRLFIKNTLI